MENKKIIYIILLIIFIILSLILIIQILLKLMGKSPDDPQLIYVALGIIISYLLIMSYGLGKFVGRVDEFMKTSKNTFKRISKDFEKVDKNFERVNKNIENLGEKLAKK